MTTPEQQAREMLQRATSFDLTELANLIDEHDALKAELEAIKQGAGEPVGHVSNGYAGRIKRIGVVSLYRDKTNGSDVALYTRPCVPLTDEQIVSIRDEHLPSQGDSFDCVAFARAVEAHIKGAKG